MGNGLRGKLSGKRPLLLIAAVIAAIGIAAPQAHAGWGEPFAVSPPPMDDAGSWQGQVLADDHGNFTYLWIQTSGYTATLHSRKVYANGSEGPTRNVAVPDSFGSPREFAASMGPDGRVRVLLIRQDEHCSPICDYAYQLEYAILDADGSLDTIEGIDGTSFFSGTGIISPSIATNDQGDSVMLWSKGSFGDSDVRIATAEDGSSPSDPDDLVEGWLGINSTAVTASANGSFGLVYSGYNTGWDDNQIGAQLLLANGTLTEPRQPNSEIAYSVNDVAAVIDSSGRSTISWRQYNGSDTQIFYRQMDSSGNLILGAPSVGSNETSITADSSHDGLALAPNGTVFLAFSQAQEELGLGGVWVRTISPAGVRGPAHLLAGATNDLDAWAPIVAAGPGGGGLMLYETIDESSDPGREWTVSAIAFNASGQAVGSPTVLESLDADNSNDTLDSGGLAFSTTGDAAAIWDREYEAADYEYQIHGAIYDGSPPSATLWAPPQATAGQEVVMGVEASDRSPITYAWSVDGTSIAGNGPFVRHTFGSAGAKAVKVVVSDSSGNATTVEATVEVKAAGTPPVPPDTRITGKPAKRTKKKTAAFRFVSSLPGSRFECRLDRAGWTDCRSPKKLKKLKPGKHVFRVRAIKGDLIDRTPASWTWTVKKAKKAKKRR